MRSERPDSSGQDSADAELGLTATPVDVSVSAPLGPPSRNSSVNQTLFRYARWWWTTEQGDPSGLLARQLFSAAPPLRLTNGCHRRWLSASGQCISEESHCEHGITCCAIGVLLGVVEAKLIDVGHHALR